MDDCNTEDRGKAGPASARASIDCRAASDMLEIGPRRLSETALMELAEHLDACDACSETFDKVCPPIPDETESADSLARSAPTALLSRLIGEVVHEYNSHRPAKSLLVVHQGRA